jgi:hypothetical protein
MGWREIEAMKNLKEEIGRNYHTLDPVAIPYDYDDNIRVSTIATPAGKWQVKINVGSHPDLSMPTRVFDEEMQADHYARAMVSKIKTKIDNQLIREYVQKILSKNL